jgi:hypothetical protein
MVRFENWRHPIYFVLSIYSYFYSSRPWLGIASVCTMVALFYSWGHRTHFILVLVLISLPEVWELWASISATQPPIFFEFLVLDELNTSSSYNFLIPRYPDRSWWPKICQPILGIDRGSGNEKAPRTSLRPLLTYSEISRQRTGETSNAPKKHIRLVRVLVPEIFGWLIKSDNFPDRKNSGTSRPHWGGTFPEFQ